MPHSSSTRILLVRHGETEWNLAARLQGHRDSPLTRRGVEQARQLARRMPELRPHIIATSDLGRTLRTAEILAEPLGTVVEPRAALREKRGGIFEGLTWKEISSRYPEELRRYQTERPLYAPPGGESWGDAGDRAMAALYSLVEDYRGKTVMAVTHGGILNVVLRRILHIPDTAPRSFEVGNLSLHVLVHDAEQFWLETLGDLHHLSTKVLDDVESAP
jgi:probable phosphoglycerate mutase